jgi:hypothetical protein
MIEILDDTLFSKTEFADYFELFREFGTNI